MDRLGRVGLLVLASAAGAAQGQAYVLDRSAPDADRWNYPFNSTPGTKETAPSFGAVLIPGFDDRDAQFLVGFETEGEVPQGLGAGQYHVTRVVVTAAVANDGEFIYDPTPDAWTTHLDPADPAFTPDADPGRPLELFGTGFRNGFSSATWTETSPFGGAPVVPPAQGARNAFAAVFNAAGVATDVSNNLKERFEAPAWGVGTTAAVAPGAAVPIDTVFTFDLDLCQPGARAYVARALDEGRLLVSISSLQPASGGPGGGEGVVYPAWYTRENVLADLLGLTATLHLEVRVGNAADLDANGLLNVDDIDAFVGAFLSGDSAADITGDCVLNVDDLDAMVSAFLGG